MKVHSLTILHYGADYLSYALRSVYHNVDQCHIFYTPTPSHGHSTDIPPVETRDQLRQSAYSYDPDNKVRWYDMVNITHEGPQRDIAIRTVQTEGAELVVVVDCDEVWPLDTLKRAIVHAKINPNKKYQFLVNMTHLWRSFNWACSDNGWPIRLFDMRYSGGVEYLSDIGKVYHFGYAVCNVVMNYKWLIHGHKNELRQGWLEDKWAAWPPPDNCHPTNGRNEYGEPFWTPKPFDKSVLPEFMSEHPFYGVDRID